MPIKAIAPSADAGLQIGSNGMAVRNAQALVQNYKLWAIIERTLEGERDLGQPLA